MPEQLRAHWPFRERKRNQKEHCANEPSGARNCRTGPGQMDQSASDRIKCVRRNILSASKSLISWSKRKNQPKPNCDRCGIGDCIPNDYARDESLFQMRCEEQRIDHGYVV